MSIVKRERQLRHQIDTHANTELIAELGRVVIIQVGAVERTCARAAEGAGTTVKLSGAEPAADTALIRIASRI
jgi:hypothetical protein